MFVSWNSLYAARSKGRSSVSSRLLSMRTNQRTIGRVFRGLLPVALAIVITHPASPARTQSRSSNGPVWYEGARLIPGDGSPAIEGAAMLVENGMITRVTKGRV